MTKKDKEDKKTREWEVLFTITIIKKKLLTLPADKTEDDIRDIYYDDVVKILDLAEKVVYPGWEDEGERDSVFDVNELRSKPESSIFDQLNEAMQGEIK